jgi:hypothetical protein
MKQRFVWLGLLTLSFALAAMAASDLSGTWIIDKAKSDPPRMGRGGDSAGPPRDYNITLVIKQTSKEVAINRTMSMNGNDRTSDQKFSLDGKENTNSSAMGRGEFTAKAKFSEGKLVVEGTQKMSTPNGDFEIDVRDEYSLADDGKVLILTSTRSTLMGDRTSKQTYNKK